MTDYPIVSIIIPMYNCGKFISRCIASIDYPAVEIIVVDDGSIDNGPTLVDGLIESHPNLRLIRKKNGGVSSARNVGIDSANGKYIMFIDADDYIAPDGISRIVDIAEKYRADIVTYSNISKSEDSPVDDISVKDIEIEAKIIEGRAAALQTYTILDYLVWRALFLRSIIFNHSIRFDEDLHLHEDDTFMGKYYCYTSKIVCTNLPLYRYTYCSSSSSTHCQSMDRYRVLIESGSLAMKYRSRYIRTVFTNDEFPYERLKYMRWVCSPKQAIEAGYSMKEYKTKLLEYNQLDGVGKIWPISYKWIKVAGFDYSLSAYAKWVIKTFLLNHPLISYPLAKLRYK